VIRFFIDAQSILRQDFFLRRLELIFNEVYRAFEVFPYPISYSRLFFLDLNKNMQKEQTQNFVKSIKKVLKYFFHPIDSVGRPGLNNLAVGIILLRFVQFQTD
jgi:hypothetical protein